MRGHAPQPAVEIWPIPITLATDLECSVGDVVELSAPNGKALGRLTVEEIFERDVELEAEKVYRTTDGEHPGVAAIREEGARCIAGPIEVDALPDHDEAFMKRYQTTEESKQAFADRGWKRIVAFQTRNPIHRAHEYLTKAALEICDGLYIHPLIGETKKGDIPADVRMRCYEVLMDNYYHPDHVMLGVNPGKMHYAGPREAVLHAIIRRNYGCTHFIVGRDHAGVGDYYGTYDAQRIFDDIDTAELGITPLFFEHTFWCNECEGMGSAKTCPHPQESHLFLSGTKVREMLEAGEKPPHEFSRDEVAEILIDAYKEEDRLMADDKGFCLWFTGLSGSGKSTITTHLVKELRKRGSKLEVLDGDVVRENLSKGLGFSKEDRDTNIRRIAFVANLLSRNDVPVITAAISPYREIRDEARQMMGDRFVEAYVKASVEVCEQRDVKGLYAKARSGEIKEFTGVSDPYEPPENPELVIETEQQSPEESAQQILAYLEERELDPGGRRRLAR